MERPIVLTTRYPIKGSKRLQMSKDDYYKGLVRAIQVTDRFDRVGLTILLHNFPSPTKDRLHVVVNTKLLELYDNNFIEVATMDTTKGTLAVQYEYTEAELIKNPELSGVLDFATGNKKCIAFRKAAGWPDFMLLWRDFVG